MIRKSGTILAIFLGLAVTVLAVTACSKKESPEQRVRQLLEQAEIAAEQKDITTVTSFLDGAYTDHHGNNKKRIEQLLRFYLFGRQSVHLYTYIKNISFSPLKQANVVFYVAMAGTPLPDVEEVQRLQADLFRFELTLSETSGEWRVIRAEWRRAEIIDIGP